jgi:hypothetical protein
VSFSVGSVVGKWVCTGESRSGGRSVVWRVTGPNAQQGALKRAREGSESALRAELAEIDAVVQRDPAAAHWLSVPLDRGEMPPGRPYFVMPWVEHSFRSWVEQAAPPFVERMRVLAQAVHAVHRLHESGRNWGEPRLHNDLKPENFLVASGSRLLLADLGEARARSLVEVGAGGQRFSPGYAPPERALGLETTPDPTIDAFALGVVVYWAIVESEPRGLPWSLTAAGERLLELRGYGAPSGQEQHERAELQRRPLAALLDLPAAVCFSAADEARFSHAVEDALRTDGIDHPGGVAVRVAAPILVALKRALEPNPGQRDGDLRRFAAAFEHAIATLGGEMPVLAGMAVPNTSRPVLTEGVVPSVGPRDSAVSAAPVVALSRPALAEVPLLGLFEEQADATDEVTAAVPEEAVADPLAGWLPYGVGVLVVGLLGWWAFTLAR